MKAPLNNNYSGFVHLMKILLPVGIVLTLGFAIAWPYLHSIEKKDPLLVDISSPEIQENRMMKPEYISTDKKGQPFKVDAEWAKKETEQVSDLVKPHGVITLDKGETLELNADAGKYDSEGKVLNLEGDVTLTSSDGYKVITQSAQMEVDSKTIEGNKHVEGQGPAGSIMGQDGFRIEDKGNGQKIITLKGQSRVVINKGATKKKETNG
jgi:lipopolysaccharide export system protein LptC